MTELNEAVAAWMSLLLVLVVFGFAPGFCLRLIVFAYPRDDPRRAELIAELYAVPRIQRPLWVAEQLEVALFEGLAHRVSATLRRQSVLGPVTTGAAVLVIAFSGIGLLTKSAEPEESELTLSEEHTECGWFTLDDAAKAVQWDSNRTALWELDHRLRHGTVHPAA